MFSRNASPTTVIEDPSTMVVPRQYIVFIYRGEASIYDLYATCNRTYWMYQQERISMSDWGHLSRCLDRLRFDIDPDREMMMIKVPANGLPQEFMTADLWFRDHGVLVDMEEWREDLGLETLRMLETPLLDLGDLGLSDLEDDDDLESVAEEDIGDVSDTFRS